MPFETNVFINCPFDDDYTELQSNIVFTLVYLGLNPLIASLVKDSGQVRLARIFDMIRKAKYSIHDISRLQSIEKNDFFRLNMPLELGIDFGARQFSNGLNGKRFLILATRKHDYHKAISDLSGCDIESHNDNAEKIVQKVRDWIENQSPREADGAARISSRYIEFQEHLYESLISRGFSEHDAKNPQLSELVAEMKKWIAQPSKNK